MCVMDERIGLDWTIFFPKRLLKILSYVEKSKSFTCGTKWPPLVAPHTRKVSRNDTVPCRQVHSSKTSIKSSTIRPSQEICSALSNALENRQFNIPLWDHSNPLRSGLTFRMSPSANICLSDRIKTSFVRPPSISDARARLTRSSNGRMERSGMYISVDAGDKMPIWTLSGCMV